MDHPTLSDTTTRGDRGAQERGEERGYPPYPGQGTHLERVVDELQCLGLAHVVPLPLAEERPGELAGETCRQL